MKNKEVEIKKVEIKEVIDKASVVYQSMQNSRYLSSLSLRSDKKEFLDLENIKSKLDNLSTIELKKEITNLQAILSKQSDSKLKNVVDLLVICVMVKAAEMEAIDAFNTLNTLEAHVKYHYGSSWSIKGDANFCTKFHELTVLASAFINQFALNFDKSLFPAAFNQEEQLALTQSCIDKTEIEIQKQGEKLSELDELKNQQQKQVDETVTKIKQTSDQTEAQLLVAHSLRETLKKQEQLLKTIEQEKTEAAKLLRFKITEVESLKEKKEQQTVELFRVNQMISELMAEKNLTKQQNQMLLTTNQNLEIKLQDAQLKYANVMQYFLCTEEDIGNITRDEFKKLKEIRQSDKLFSQKYHKLISLDQGTKQNLADTFYIRYKDIYQNIFNPVSNIQPNTENRELKKEQIVMDCTRLQTCILHHYPLADFAKHVALVAPSNESDQIFKDKIEFCDELSKTTAEFAEEALKRVNNLLDDKVSKWEKKLANFAHRNLELIDRAIENDVKKDLINMQKMMAKS